MLRERVNPTDAYALEWQIRQLQKGQHETFVFLGNLGVGISAERLAAGDFDGYDEVFLLLDDTDDYLPGRCRSTSRRAVSDGQLPRHARSGGPAL